MSKEDGILPIGTSRPAELERLRAPLIHPTALDHETYMNVFRLDIDSLAGKRVLDIGGGATDFTAHLLDNGVDAYSLDPRYTDKALPKIRGEILGLLEQGEHDEELIDSTMAIVDCFYESRIQHPDRYRFGYATNLPFADGMFDVVVSSELHYRHLIFDDTSFIDSICDSMRVLKKTGVFKVFPAAAVTAPYDAAAHKLWTKNKALIDGMLAGTIDDGSLTDEQFAIISQYQLALSLISVNDRIPILTNAFETEAINPDHKYMLEIKKRPTLSL